MLNGNDNLFFTPTHLCMVKQQFSLVGKTTIWNNLINLFQIYIDISISYTILYITLKRHWTLFSSVTGHIV